MADAQSEIGPVREQHRFDVAKLTRYLESHLADFAGPLTVKQFRGGQSCPTYRLDTPGQAYVLRRKPPGKLLPSAHAVNREYRVMSALAGTGVAVPQTYLLCEDAEVVGTPFFVMEYVPGRIFWDLAVPGLAGAERAAIYDAMNQTIAQLHAVNYGAIGLADYGRPVGYVARQIDRWTKQYRASETEPIEAMERLIAWLPENLPDGGATALVHGDYRLDNMIFHPTEARVIAILDWEVSTLGDPLADFAYHCMVWRLEPHAFKGLRDLDLKQLGIPDEAQYLAAYCERTGRTSIDNWDFYIAYNMFRLAAILQGIMGRVRDGTASSEAAAERGALARPVAEAGWREVEAILGSVPGRLSTPLSCTCAAPS